MSGISASSDDRLRAAEHALAVRFGGHPRLAPLAVPPGGSGRSHLVRCGVTDAPAGVPDRLIVKQLALDEGESYAPDVAGGAASRLFNEWASLQFLSELDDAPNLAPRFLAGSRAAALLVMEDLGEGQSLADVLLGPDHPPAEAGLSAYFRALGRLNAATYGREARYVELRAALGPLDPLARPPLAQERDLLLRNLREVCRRVDVPLSPECERDVASAARFGAEPGPFLAFSQSDTCPDNCMLGGEQVRFLDFEWGWFRSALNDGARARSNFPTCWCVGRLPDDLTRRLEAIYRAELARGCPAAQDDALFEAELVRACAYWTLHAFEFYGDLWTADWEWGTATTRQRAIFRFGQLARTCAEFGLLPALGAVAAVVAERLQALWPTTPPMPLYVPFRPPSEASDR